VQYFCGQDAVSGVGADQLTNKSTLDKTTDDAKDAEESSGTREGLHSVWRVQRALCWYSYDTTPVDKHTTNSTRTQLSAGQGTHKLTATSRESTTNKLIFSSLQFTHHTCACHTVTGPVTLPGPTMMTQTLP